ncbi:thioredoxin-like protein [Lactarius deliciosus]|nr:thioredoxin-like protein [Lactarius deliciosus]
MVLSRSVSLADYLGQWVILMFYPLDSTFFCPTEILAFNDALLEFSRLNTTVLAISTDSEYSHHAWAQQARSAGGLGPDLRIPLLADRNMRIARDYGCLIEDKGITFRASYLVDPKGILRQITMNDPPIGRSVDEALRLVQAFQFSGRCARRGVSRELEGGARPSARTRLRNSITLPPPLMGRTRTARRTGPSVRAWTPSERYLTI